MLEIFLGQIHFLIRMCWYISGANIDKWFWWIFSFPGYFLTQLYDGDEDLTKNYATEDFPSDFMITLVEHSQHPQTTIESFLYKMFPDSLNTFWPLLCWNTVENGAGMGAKCSHTLSKWAIWHYPPFNTPNGRYRMYFLFISCLAPK